MATAAEWVQGARPRTLPAAVAPVLAGTGLAAHDGDGVWWKALLALVVSVALQVGVNYANDYSDGIRGTDDDRVGPLRLVASQVAAPAAVKRAAFLSFAVAAAAGLVLAATTAWWLVAVGAVSVVAAWFYTGGSKPYGYLGLGEVMVFVFFGLVAVVGTAYVQTERWSWAALAAGVGVGALACAILVVNNLRDVPTDRVAGKITLAVRLGEPRTRVLYVALVVAAALAVVAVAALTSWWALLGLGFLAVAAPAVRTVLAGARRARPRARAAGDRHGRARLGPARGRRAAAVRLLVDVFLRPHLLEAGRRHARPVLHALRQLLARAAQHEVRADATHHEGDEERDGEGRRVPDCQRDADRDRPGAEEQHQPQPGVDGELLHPFRIERCDHRAPTLVVCCGSW